MLKDFLKKNITSQASYVQYGYAQVEPNHLSARRNGQIYAQLPAKADIDVLEQGQFVKYDYATGEVNFTGPGEWMLVFNEIKLYREDQMDCEFALKKDDYQARLYSPFGGYKEGTPFATQTRFYNGTNGDTPANELSTCEDVTAGPDYREINYNEDPFHIEGAYNPAKMPANTSMVPRVFKTQIGDIYTTNCVNEASLVAGDKLYVGAKGILTKTSAEESAGTFAGSGSMIWQVAKVYTMPDGQAGVKLVRIA